MLKKAKAQAKADADHRDKAHGTHDPTRDFGQGIRESSRQIWLAGLGAFSRAQAEGTKLFETLVDQGQTLESRTRRAASETAAAAAGAAAQKAKEMHAMAGGTWDKLEQVFEDRVARALSKLGVYTQQDVTRLAERVDALSEAVNDLIKSQGGKPRKDASRPVAAKRPRKARAAPAAESSPAAAPARVRRTPRKRAAKKSA